MQNHPECPIENGRMQVQRIAAKISDVGGIPVARAIPQKERRIGPWCYLDHIGPFTDGTELNAGRIRTLHFSPIVAMDLFAAENTELTLTLDPSFEYAPCHSKAFSVSMTKASTTTNWTRVAAYC